MKRERVIKKLMAVGASRNEANLYLKEMHSYGMTNQFAYHYWHCLRCKYYHRDRLDDKCYECFRLHEQQDQDWWPWRF